MNSKERAESESCQYVLHRNRPSAVIKISLSIHRIDLGLHPSVGGAPQGHKSSCLVLAMDLLYHIWAAVAEWSRYRIVAGLVTSSNPVPPKTRRVGQRCTLNLSRAQTSSRWSGVVVRRGRCQLRCRLRHLTMAQNDVTKSPCVAEQCDVKIHSLTVPHPRENIESRQI
ncbi:uncharacterized protein TNCV_516541 [Trichonephila clavipes]|nr:uncharacterized protein TNCV_516541 [Trichonephila clavipes]